jgi:hypothetical protein
MTPCEAEVRNRKELEKIRAKQVWTKTQAPPHCKPDLTKDLTEQNRVSD